MTIIGHARVVARVLMIILAFNAGTARAAEVGHGIAWMSVGAAIGILAMDAGIEVAHAAEHRRLKRWADKGIAAHEAETAAQARDARRRPRAPVWIPPKPPVGPMAPPLGRSLRLLRPPDDRGDRPC